MREKSAKPPARRKVRVLVAKVGLDGHDRGVKIVARALRDAGIEVVYLGIHNTPTDIVVSAIQEDVDAIGLSIHSAAHMTLFGEVIKLLKKNRARHIAVFGGGIVPEEDEGTLKRMGVQKIFTPGAPLEEIVKFVKSIGVKTPEARAGRQKSLPRIAERAPVADRATVNRRKRKRT
jgi:methylmalonyl-CoA mutase C-terminal domain/subunit